MAVTVDDVKRVARTYFNKENRAVALYFRKEGAAAEEELKQPAAATAAGGSE